MKQLKIILHRFCILITLVIIINTFCNAQTVNVINRCGGSHVITLPNFIDNDHDGISDSLENKLANYFMPTFIQFSNENCGGPSSDTANINDSNLVVCRVFPLLQQYTSNNSLALIKDTPTVIVNEKCLNTGLVWYNNQINIYGAVLYAQDCGLHGHTADVEGFSFSLKYIGVQDDVSWRYDTIMAHWQGIMIQTISHAGTICQITETKPYLSVEHPDGKDTIYVSPNKHGNYLTIQGCNSSIICNPGCNNAQSLKKIKPINIGEPMFPMITDLGYYYAEYAGQNPWSDTNFLSGGAGTIKESLVHEWKTNFLTYERINTCNDICAIYNACYNCNAGFTNCTSACISIDSSQTGCNSPAFDCATGISNNTNAKQIQVFPNPAKSEIFIFIDDNKQNHTIALKNSFGAIVKEFITTASKSTIKTDDLAVGNYFLIIDEKTVNEYSELILIR